MRWESTPIIAGKASESRQAGGDAAPCDLVGNDEVLEVDERRDDHQPEQNPEREGQFPMARVPATCSQAARKSSAVSSSTPK